MKQILASATVVLAVIILGGCAYDNSRFYQPTFEPGGSGPSSAPMELALCDVREGFMGPGIIVDWRHIGPRFAVQNSNCGAPRDGAMWLRSSKASGYYLLNTNDIDGSGAMSSYYYAELIPNELIGAGRLGSTTTDGDPDNRPAANSAYRFVLDDDDVQQINGRMWRYRRWHWEKDGESRARTPREEYRMQAAPGWTFFIRFNTSIKRDGHPELLEARRRTLRKMVESVKIERLDMVWAEQELQRQKEVECVRYPKSCRGDKRSQH